ncbi:hypothetical protein [Vannielia litorea]|uniref:hypothetical protein n=1 Tax=Vannielia litorea TaxID=1217970 RepID=UPI001C95FA57|nr:hypothetical protein [Vannielia litorea]MBY6047064.1 hypothetical protein [Vannielia litorea]MBY6074478.1 hypothetical protein [Vannielia litorea]
MEHKGIFWPAVGEVWRGRGTALRVIWLPFLISTIAYEAYYRAFPSGIALPVTVLEFLVFSWAAVGWHRVALLDEAPGPAGTRHGGPVPRYAFGWFISGLAAGILGMMLFLVVYLGLTRLFGVGVFMPMPGLPEVLLSPMAYLSTAFWVLPLGIGCMWLVIYLFFHFARALPALAIRRDGRWNEAQRGARRRWFASAAAWSLLLWLLAAALYYGTYNALLEWDNRLWEAGQDGAPLWAFSLLDAAFNVVYAMNVLIGSSVLTIAFRRSASVAPENDAGQAE